MLHARGAEVAEDLGDMFVDQRLTGFQLDYETAFDKKICVILSKSRTVLVGHLQGILLLETDPGLSQTMGQSVLINLLQVPMPQVPVQGEANLPNPITQCQDLVVVHHCAPLGFPLRGVRCPAPSTRLVVGPWPFSLTLCFLCVLWL